MSKRKKAGENHGQLKLIKDIVEANDVSIKEIASLADIDYPLFSFKYLRDVSINKCGDAAFFHDFLMRLQKLSELGWDGIRKSHKHSFGMENIPRESLKPDCRLPAFVTRDVSQLQVFRASGDNRPFIGLQQGRFFHILFIEARFGDIYEH